MDPQKHRKAMLHSILDPVERLLQVNAALMIAQAVIIRLSLELADQTSRQPDLLVIIAFLATCVVAALLVFVLNRVIRRFPRRSTRILIAVGTLVVQAVAFHLLQTYAV